MKVLLVANSDWGLYNFRLPIAAALREQGVQVVLVCPEGPYSPRLNEAGYRVLHWELRRRSMNPVLEARALLHLIQLYRRELPDAVHHFTIKPNVYGTIAARLTRVPHIINTWTGLGFTFSVAPLARGLRLFLLPFMQQLYRSSRVSTVFQTEHDRQALLQLGLADVSRSAVIAGSGVDTSRFTPHKHCTKGPPKVLMAARLLRDKGVGELVQATTLLRQSGAVAYVQVSRAPDPGNPGSLTSAEIERWHNQGQVEFLGHRDDVPSLLAQADIAVLPTYYNEGVPFFLLEAAASGLPLIATDIEGCRAVVREGVNGFIIPPRDPQALAEAMANLIADPALRARMGAASREIAVNQFDQPRIIGQYMDLYRRIGCLPGR